MRAFIKKRCLAPILAWLLCYLALFLYLEVFAPKEAHLVSCRLDSRIPFLPVFVYPYLSWFPYILVCAFLAIRNLEDKDYKRVVLILTAGMNLFLAISFLWPTGLELREGLVYDMGAMSGRLMKFVQTVDAPRSVFPSMHVFVTLVFQYTLELQRGKVPAWVVRLGRLLAAAIVLSTMFTKQHSVLDVLGATVLFASLSWGCSALQRARG